jgi:hypothetical protein
MSAAPKSNELASFGGEVVPIGIYAAKLAKIEDRSSDTSGVNYVVVTAEVLEGEAEGLTTQIMIFPKVTKSPKNGKYYSRGLSEAGAMAAAWGAPLPEYDLDGFMGETTPAAARMLQKMLFDSFVKAGRPKLRIKVYAEKQQAKNESTGKWEDAKGDDGAQLFRNKTLVLGKLSGSAPIAGEVREVTAAQSLV